jgi:hypothetical protein
MTIAMVAAKDMTAELRLGMGSIQIQPSRCCFLVLLQRLL